jgi:formate--tetrahydrofolate ligase
MPLEEKIRTVAKEIYRAKDVSFSDVAKKKLAEFTAMGFGNLPICVAKTQYSFSHDKNLICAPKDFIFPIQDVRLYSGAGFVVPLAGDIMTMPGLPKVPAACSIDVDDDGVITGLF